MALADMLFDTNAGTFRKGRIDSWIKEFTPELYGIFLEESRELRELWGYAPEEGTMTTNPVSARPEPALEARPWRYHTMRDREGALVWEGQFDLYRYWHHFGIPDDLSGQTVLDIGTGSGFFAFECERRGASRVVATELAKLADWDSRQTVSYDGPDIPAGNRRDFAELHARLNSAVSLVPFNISELRPGELGQFDWVIFGSLMTHIKDPMRALVNLRALSRGRAVVISSYLKGENNPCMHWIHTPRPFDWWVPAKSLVPMMLMAAGFSTVVETGDFVLEHRDGPKHDQACWHAMA